MIEAGRSFRIVVLSELLARPEYSATPEPLFEPRRIDRVRLDEVMHALGVTLSLDVPDPFAPGRRLELAPIRLDAIKAFKPGALADSVPELRALRATSQVLLDFEQRRRTLPDALEQVERALAARGWAAQITSLFSSAPEPARPEPAPETATAAPKRAPASGLDALFDMVELPGAAATAVPQLERPGSNAIEDLMRQVVAAGAKPEGTRQDSARARALTDHAFSSLLDALLQHPEWLRLERAWRGLRLLVEHADARSGAEIDVIAARPSRVLGALEQLALRDGAEQGRSPVDLIIVDHEVDGSARDRALLSSWGLLAERLRAPLLASASPSLLGFATLADLAKTRKSLARSDEPWAVGLRALSGRPESRWLMLALNGMLVRAPYTAESSKLGQLQFAESAATATTFAAAPFAAAILALRSFASHGHPLDLHGAQGGPSMVSNLTVHEVGAGQERTAIAVEALLEAETQSELGRVGVVALAAVRNRDRAVLTNLPMLFREPGPADTNPELSLTDQLFVGRMARIIEQLADAIPESAEERAIQEVAAVTLAELFADGAPPGPDVVIEVARSPRRLVVSVRPRRYWGVSIEDITFQAPLTRDH